MSSNSQTFNNGQQVQVNTNLAKLFPFNKEFIQYVKTNSTYVDETIPAGTVMGVVSATGLIKPMTSGASDGSQFAMGILAEDYVIPFGDSINVAVMVKGYVRKDMIILQGSDTLNTVVSGRRVFETLLAAGVFIQSVQNATNYDNAL